MYKNYNVSVYQGNDFAYLAIADEAGMVIERKPNMYSDANGEVTVKTDAVTVDPHADIKRKLIARIYSKKKPKADIEREYKEALEKELQKLN